MATRIEVAFDDRMSAVAFHEEMRAVPEFLATYVDDPEEESMFLVLVSPTLPAQVIDDAIVGRLREIVDRHGGNVMAAGLFPVTLAS